VNECQLAVFDDSSTHVSCQLTVMQLRHLFEAEARKVFILFYLMFTAITHVKITSPRAIACH